MLRNGKGLSLIIVVELYRQMKDKEKSQLLQCPLKNMRCCNIYKEKRSCFVKYVTISIQILQILVRYDKDILLGHTWARNLNLLCSSMNFLIKFCFSKYSIRLVRIASCSIFGQVPHHLPNPRCCLITLACLH